MKYFKTYFALDCKRIFKPLRIWVFILVLMISLYFVQEGIWEYEGLNVNKANFLRLERENIKTFINYTQYGSFGVRLLFFPSPASVFFPNTGLDPDYTALIDSGARLRINNSFLGKNLYAENINGFNDFSGFLFFVVSITGLFWGYVALRYPKLFKFLVSFSSYRSVFFSYIGAKFLLLAVLIIITAGGAILVTLINDIHLASKDIGDIGVFIGMILLVALFFFLMGTIAGSFKSKVVGIIGVVISWFVFMVLIPGAITKFVAEKADNITSMYNIEQEKLKILMDFEKRAYDQAQRYKSIQEKQESNRRLADDYWNNEFKKIQTVEGKMQKEMMDNFHYYQRLSMLFPTTFFQSVSNEVSSKGYGNFFRFYKYSQDVHEGFVKYYQVKKFYSNYSRVVPYLRGEDNVFRGECMLPENFIPGLVITCIYIAGLLWISLFGFRKVLYSFPANWEIGLKNPTLKMKKGELRIFYVEDERFSHQLFNLLSGRGKAFKENAFIGKVFIDEKDICIQPPDEKFLYVARIENIPGDIRGCDIVRLSGGTPKETTCSKKSLEQLTREEKENFYLSLFNGKKFDIYLIDDIGKGMSITFILELKRRLEKLSREGALVMYLTTDYQPPFISLKKEETFFNHTRWVQVVESLEGIT